MKVQLKFYGVRSPNDPLTPGRYFWHYVGIAANGVVKRLVDEDGYIPDGEYELPDDEWNPEKLDDWEDQW